MLFEFANKDAFRHKNPTKLYTLPFKFSGNSHVVYSNYFYYNQDGTNKLIKYDLMSNHTYFRSIEDAAFRPQPHYLYETQYNHMDINADENGLWVIFASSNTNNTLVVKIDPFSLGTENVWNISLDHQMIGEMFIACGVLYGIESATDTFTRIRFAFDLYLSTPIDVSRHSLTHSVCNNQIPLVINYSLGCVECSSLLSGCAFVESELSEQIHSHTHSTKRYINLPKFFCFLLLLRFLEHTRIHAHRFRLTLPILSSTTT